MALVHVIEGPAHTHVIILEQVRLLFNIFLVTVHEKGRPGDLVIFFGAFIILSCCEFNRKDKCLILNLTDGDDLFEWLLRLVGVSLLQ